jgi:hypothetical protein
MNTQDFKVGDLVWTMKQRLEDSQYGWELLEPKKVKITKLSENSPKRATPYGYEVHECDENGNIYNLCFCNPDEIYKTEKDAKTAYKGEIECQINKLKRQILHWEEKLLDLQS